MSKTYRSPKNSNVNYQNDLTFGLSEEIRIKTILEDNFGSLESLDKYNPFDFENDKYLLELKSRRVTHNQYPTAMVNYSKLVKTKDTTKTRIIIFNYTDGIYYWLVNEDEYSTGLGGRNDRGLDEFSKMAYVPKENLKLLEVGGRCQL